MSHLFPRRCVPPVRVDAYERSLFFVCFEMIRLEECLGAAVKRGAYVIRSPGGVPCTAVVKRDV